MHFSDDHPATPVVVAIMIHNNGTMLAIAISVVISVADMNANTEGPDSDTEFVSHDGCQRSNHDSKSQSGANKLLHKSLLSRQ